MAKSVFSRPRSLREWGQTMALMAIALPTVVGGLGLASDVGNFYYNYYKLQTGVDAAVISSVTYLASPTGGISAAENAACNSGAGSCLSSGAGTPTGASFGYSNGIGTGSGGAAGDVVTFTGTNSSNLKMQVQRTVPYYFSRLIGVNSGTLNVSASAPIGPPTAVGNGSCTSSCNNTNLASNIVPIGVQYESACATGGYCMGQPINLIYRGVSGSGPQYWGGLIFGPPGASTFSNQLQFGWQYKLSIGDVLPAETGAKTGPTTSAINARLTAAATDPAFSADHCNTSSCVITPGDPRAVIVPLVDWTSPACASGSCTIIAFATIWIKGVGTSGCGSSATSPLDICGVWTQSVITSGTVNSGSPSWTCPPGCGISVAKLNG